MKLACIPQLVVIITGLTIIDQVSCHEFTFSSSFVPLTVGSRKEIIFYTRTAKIQSTKSGATVNKSVPITFKSEDPQIAKAVSPRIIRGDKGDTVLHIVGEKAGRTIITASLHDSKDYSPEAYVHVSVMKYPILNTISTVVGWIYFCLWTVSFYPQMYMNYTRKSVVGLNFDFVSLNFIGFSLYSVYNCGLYFIPFIQREYFHRYSNGDNPVKFNDVFFSVHAAVACAVYAVQCSIYEKKDQEVTLIAKTIIMTYYNVVLVTGVCAYLNAMHWLDFLNYCSYIKLTITMIKYIPQAITNHRRKSTVGWSIGNIMCDFGGGVFSISQMLIDGYNFDDYANIMGDATKFGLGLFSISFDLLFIYQHYVLYRKREPKSETIMTSGSFSK